MRIPSEVTLKAGRQLLLARKNSPQALFIGGLFGVTVSTVLACRATLRLEETMVEAKKDLEIAHSIDAPEKYSETDRKHDIAIIYTRSVVKVAKLYAPAVIVGVASVGALTASHRILNQRNLALMAAYTAVDEAFTKYRSRVVDKYGEEEDQLLRYDHEEVRVLNPETNRHHAAIRVAPGAESQYARFFDQLSAEWSKEPEYNLAFLRTQQNYWNDMLRARGHVFLNEVYKSLGIDHSQAGAVVGWVLGDDGDNFIDFGIYRDDEKANDFVNGREGAILLDFNVDGVIYNKIGSGKAIPWQR